jgi:phage terminase large subunit-like protein
MRLSCEINQGGDMVRHTLDSVRPGLPIVEVRATRGKHIRAEPISSLYSLGRVSHVGTFTELESQMVQMTAGGFEGEGSPDRVDALVWGFTHLFPKLVQRPSITKKVFVPHATSGWMG